MYVCRHEHTHVCVTMQVRSPGLVIYVTAWHTLSTQLLLNLLFSKSRQKEQED